MLSTEIEQNKWYQTSDQMSAMQREAVNIAKLGAHLPLLAFLELANAFQQPIYTVHTDKLFKC